MKTIILNGKSNFNQLCSPLLMGLALVGLTFAVMLSPTKARANFVATPEFKLVNFTVDHSTPLLYKQKLQDQQPPLKSIDFNKIAADQLKLDLKSLINQESPDFLSLQGIWTKENRQAISEVAQELGYYVGTEMMEEYDRKHFDKRQRQANHSGLEILIHQRLAPESYFKVDYFFLLNEPKGSWARTLLDMKSNLIRGVLYVQMKNRQRVQIAVATLQFSDTLREENTKKNQIQFLKEKLQELNMRKWIIGAGPYDSIDLESALNPKKFVNISNQFSYVSGYEKAANNPVLHYNPQVARDQLATSQNFSALLGRRAAASK